MRSSVGESSGKESAKRAEAVVRVIVRGSLDGDGVLDLFLEHAAFRATLFCELFS